MALPEEHGAPQTPAAEPARASSLNPQLVENYNELPDSWKEYGAAAEDDEFRDALELTPHEREMLDQYSGQDQRLRELDSAMKDAVNMVKVSDQRITYLRKMHALLLLKRVKEALDTYKEEGGPPVDGDDDDGEDYESDKDSAVMYQPAKGAAKESAMLLGASGGSFTSKRSYGGMSRGTAKSHYTVDKEALLGKEDDADKEYMAAPFYSDNPTYTEGTDISKDPEADEEAPEGPRFAHKYKRRRRLNITGSLVFFTFCLALGFYLWVRVTKTLDLGPYLWYGILVLSVECLGATTTLIYGMNLLLLPVYDTPGKADEAEVDIEAAQQAPEFAAGKLGTAYHLRVLIPCYKETYDIVHRTLTAARDAVLPAGCSRTIYLCDDGKDKRKRRLCQRLGRDVVYVSGRVRPVGEINGKSANMNNCLRQIYPDGVRVPAHEVVCVFDADQVADPTFYLKMVPMLDGGDDVGMVLSPQCFHNLNQHADIFNHQNIHFWEYMQPGYDALGFISCTGTNFLVRANCFQECGWSPEYTLTEDFALGMEMKKLGWQCRYMPDYLAVGEAPDQVRNCFQQKSRWCKGHFQVIFSRQHCPLFQRHLALLYKLMFCSGVWSYIVGAISTPTFILVPLATIWFGVFPIVLSWWAALGLSVYFVATELVLGYAKSMKHVGPLWFSNVANNIMWFTYVKACWRAVLAGIGLNRIAFKTTLKGMSRLADSSFGDLWMPFCVFVINIVSLVIGLHKLFTGPTVASTLTISCIWIIYNLVPVYLLLHYTFIGRGTTLKFMCRVTFLISFACGAGSLVLIWLLYPRDINYSQAVNDSYQFYDSERIGTLPANFRINWRGNAFLQDASSTLYNPLPTAPTGVADLSGGWMSGGQAGTIKMVQPTAFTVTMLAWGLLSFPQGYKSSGQTNQALNSIAVGCEFLAKTLIQYKAGSTDFYLVYQVGNITLESSYWGYPENDTFARPSYYIPTKWGASDLASSLAAAFASSALVLRSADAALAETYFGYAVDLYAAAKAYPGRYLTYIQPAPCSSPYAKGNLVNGIAKSAKICPTPYTSLNGSAAYWYNSSTYLDDLSWAATWLYSASGNTEYLLDAEDYYIQHTQQEGDADDMLLFNYDNVYWGTNVLLANLTNAGAYHSQAQYFLKYWVCGTDNEPIEYTKLGRAWNSNDGRMGTTANAVYLSSLYGQIIRNTMAAKSQRYICWARSQTRYMLGESGQSFVGGFGKMAPRRIQSMGASCYGTPAAPVTCNSAELFTSRANPHTVVGGLVEASNFTDVFPDVRTSNASRVAPEYNAGFTGAVAGLITAPGTWDMCLQGWGLLSKDTAVCQASI